MAVSQKGAVYANQAHVAAKDRLLGIALDDIASKLQAVSKLTNASTTGTQSAPPPPTAIAVTIPVAGFARVDITHNDAPAGTSYLIEYSTTPNFLTPVRVDNGVAKSWSQYLHGQALYFRAAATFYTSPQSAWVYFGSLASPSLVTL